jgi:hypothetical protein
MHIQFCLSKQQKLFVLGITAIYITLVVGLDFWQGPTWWDEANFWDNSVNFSQRLIPTIDDLGNYDALNTRLPFVIFGLLEHLFHQGIFAGRLLNLLLSKSRRKTPGFRHGDISRATDQREAAN